MFPTLGPSADIPILLMDGGRKRKRTFTQLRQGQHVIDLEPTLLTMDVVAKHSSKEDSWVVIAGVVYDVTTLVQQGCAFCLLASGTDVSEFFEHGYKHMSYNHKILSAIRTSARLVGCLGGPMPGPVEKTPAGARISLAHDEVQAVEVIEVHESQIASDSQAETQAYDFAHDAAGYLGQSSEVVDLTEDTQED